MPDQGTFADRLSPLDGRYAVIVTPLARLFSEKSLIWQRWQIELAWLVELAQLAEFGPKLSATELEKVQQLLETDPVEIADKVKQYEQQTTHDIKALEMTLIEYLNRAGLAKLAPWVHFACTSWDINNLAYARMLHEANHAVICPALDALGTQLDQLANNHADAAMLGHTHGQPATPTTFGKEIRVYEQRLRRQLIKLEAHVFDGKFNGAVGNYNAHCIADPLIDWPAVSRRFVKQMQLRFAGITTQIEPYDGIIEFFDTLARANCILLDLAQDASAYSALGYLQLRHTAASSGSSTMPHKVNPIRFENAEGNLIFANTILRMFAQELPVSRLQRDLSDSTLLRNIGVALGHSYLAWDSLREGLSSVGVNRDQMLSDLDQNWQVLAEAAQTLLRAHGHADAYAQLKQATRGNGAMDQTAYHRALADCIPAGALHDRLAQLSPENYLGLAVKLATADYAGETTNPTKTTQQ